MVCRLSGSRDKAAVGVTAGTITGGAFKNTLAMTGLARSLRMLGMQIEAGTQVIEILGANGQYCCQQNKNQKAGILNYCLHSPLPRFQRGRLVNSLNLFCV